MSIYEGLELSIIKVFSQGHKPSKEAKLGWAGGKPLYTTAALNQTISGEELSCYKASPKIMR